MASGQWPNDNREQINDNVVVVELARIGIGQDTAERRVARHGGEYIGN